MDDERPAKRLFYGDVATGSRRKGGQIRRDKDTLKSSLKRLQINPTNWTFRARIELVGHLRISCTTRTAPTVVPLSASSSSSPPPTKSDRPSEPPFPSSSASASPATHINTAHNPDTSSNINTTTVETRGEDPDYTCPHCDCTCTSHTGLVGHLRIHRIEAERPVPGAPPYTRRTRLHCPHCPRTFTHRMGLLGHMRIHESGIDRSPDTLTPPSPTLTPPPCAPTTATIFITDTDTTDFSCPHCSRTLTSHIGLVGHLRIHRTETGEPVPGAPNYTHQAHLHCPHCPRTFRHRMGLFGHMRIHKNLRWTTAGRNTLSHQHLTTHQHHPPQAPNSHLPCKREVCVSTRSPCGSCCMGDSSLRLSRRVKRRG
ncbi:hypothetical protein SprV_0602232700 [Sparganum proliferum]